MQKAIGYAVPGKKIEIHKSFFVVVVGLGEQQY
jgi:hypothetical protein